VSWADIEVPIVQGLKKITRKRPDDSMPSSVVVWRLLKIGVEISGAMEDANDMEMTARAILIPI
jgi:hypothetical protein